MTEPYVATVRYRALKLIQSTMGELGAEVIFALAVGEDASLELDRVFSVVEDREHDELEKWRVARSKCVDGVVDFDVGPLTMLMLAKQLLDPSDDPRWLREQLVLCEVRCAK